MFLLFLVSVASQRVSTPCGEIQGVRTKYLGLNAFWGIPYGKAPVGDLRWSLPRPAYTAPQDCWQGTLNATKFRNICPQANALNLPQSEDCLTLNVHSRLSNATKKLPILFSIHGGSNVEGSGYPSDSTVDPLATLMDKVCIISPNYRLGVLGYLSLHELSTQDSRSTSGNYGIEDLKLALHWVQQYASSFGCDPTNVTLIGQSSGATNIFALLSSSKNKGLFHKAIAMSGSLNITQNLQSAEAQGAKYVSSTPCAKVGSAALVKCLRNLTAAAIVTPESWTDSDFWPTDPKGWTSPGLTIVDGSTVQMPFDVALANTLVDIPLILQFTRNELEEDVLDGAQGVNKMDATKYQAFLVSNFQKFGASTGATLFDAYSGVAQQESVVTAHLDILGDVNSLCGAIDMANKSAHSSKRTTPLYLNIFAHPPGEPMCGRLTRPFHMWDLMVASHSWSWPCKRSDPPYDPSLGDFAMSEVLRNQWYSLMRTGKAEGLQAVNEGPTGSYTVAFLGAPGEPAVVNAINARLAQCRVIRKVGLLPDSRFWWIN